MANPTDLRVDDLSFEGIKDNLKNFLKSRDQFLDVNFDSSGISFLLDVLAYNTYYNSAYLNLATTEGYLTTAQKRNSLVTLARNLNYTPRSTTSARIIGTINATGTAGFPTLDLPKYTKFNANVDGNVLTFLTNETIRLVNTSGTNYTASNVELVEGTNVSERYVFNLADKNQRFLINNSLADTSTLIVRVVESTTNSTQRIFNLADNIVDISGSDLVYFLSEVEDGKFEILFGDDFIGKKLTNGNLVYLDYIVSNGPLGNDVSAVSYGSTVTNISAAIFTPNDPSSRGADRESIESIRFNAPKSYEAQNRTITTQDYVALLSKQSNINSVVVWGGEDNDPPTYGRVYIAVKPTVGLALTATEKENLINSVIKPKKILTVQTEIVDPEYIYLLVTSQVKYNSTLTTLSTAELQEIVTQTILDYNDAEINQFAKYFRFSQLSRLIDFSERSILNNSLSIRLLKEQDIQLGSQNRYEINFANPINPTTIGRFSGHPFNVGTQVNSNSFTISGFANCFFDENNGIMRIYRQVGTELIAVNNNAGEIDYASGKIILNRFNPTAFADGGNTLRLFAVPRDRDILPLRNQILTIREADVQVNMIDDVSINLTRR